MPSLDELIDMRCGKRMSCAAIGREIGLSGERVRQILREAGVDTRYGYHKTPHGAPRPDPIPKPRYHCPVCGAGVWNKGTACDHCATGILHFFSSPTLLRRAARYAAGIKVDVG